MFVTTPMVPPFESMTGPSVLNPPVAAPEMVETTALASRLGRH
jgi:hypothetical protein